LKQRGVTGASPSCRERNDLFLRLAESRCNGSGVARQVLAICKAMPDAELQEQGVDPGQIRALPDGRKGVNVVDAGIREAKARRDGKRRRPKRARPAGGSATAGRNKRRGPYTTDNDPVEDRRLAEGWVAARQDDPGLTKAQYAAREGIAVIQLGRALDRHRKRSPA